LSPDIFGEALRGMLKWLRTIDWSALVGSALVLAFFVLVVAPAIENYPYQASSSAQANQETPQEQSEETTADWTIVLGIFTGVLALISGIQGYLIYRQVNLGRDEFISSHRPKLRMRLLRIDPPEAGKPFKIYFTLANIGDTKAEIKKVDVTINTVSQMITGEFEVTLPVGDIILAGDSVDLIGESAVKFTWGTPGKNWAEGRVSIVGTITYSDDMGINRRTGFYRECSSVNRFNIPDWFSEAQRRDFEYED
jgi:hypothetical protein